MRDSRHISPAGRPSSASPHTARSRTSQHSSANVASALRHSTGAAPTAPRSRSAGADLDARAKKREADTERLRKQIAAAKAAAHRAQAAHDARKQRARAAAEHAASSHSSDDEHGSPRASVLGASTGSVGELFRAQTSQRVRRVEVPDVHAGGVAPARASSRSSRQSLTSSHKARTSGEHPVDEPPAPLSDASDDDQSSQLAMSTGDLGDSMQLLDMPAHRHSGRRAAAPARASRGSAQGSSAASHAHEPASEPPSANLHIENFHGTLVQHGSSPPRQEPSAASMRSAGRSARSAAGHDATNALRESFQSACSLPYDAPPVERANPFDALMTQQAQQRAADAEAAAEQAAAAATAARDMAAHEVATAQREAAVAVSRAEDLEDEVANLRRELAEAMAAAAAGPAADRAAGDAVTDMVHAVHEARATARATAQRGAVYLLQATLSRALLRRQAHAWGMWRAATAAASATGHVAALEEQVAVLAEELASARAAQAQLGSISDWGAEVLRLQEDLQAAHHERASLQARIAKQRSHFARRAAAGARRGAADAQAGAKDADWDSDVEAAVAEVQRDWKYQRAALEAGIQERDVQLQTLAQAVAAVAGGAGGRAQASVKRHQAATLLVLELERARKQYRTAVHTAAGMRDVIHRMRVDGRAAIFSLLQSDGSDMDSEDSGYESPASVAGSLFGRRSVLHLDESASCSSCDASSGSGSCHSGEASSQSGSDSEGPWSGEEDM